MPDAFDAFVADEMRHNAVLFSDHIGPDGLIDMDSWSVAVRGDEA